MGKSINLLSFFRLSRGRATSPISLVLVVRAGRLTKRRRSSARWLIFFFDFSTNLC
jgi:hypothetical protein